MLTGSSNSYLGQDYLQPLPTTLDAKNSPLALLAATCNNIGKDDSAKAIIPPIERKDRRDRDSKQPMSPDRNILHEKDKGSSPNDYCRKSDRSGSPRSHIDVVSPMKRDHSLDRNHSPLRRRSVSPRSPHHLSHSSSSDIKSNNNIASKISLNCGSLSVEINHKESHGSSSSSSHSHHRSPPARPSSSSSSLLPPSSSKSGSIHPPHHTGLLSTYYPHLGIPGYSLLSGANPLLAAQHKLATGESAGHTPVTYATVKTASGSSTLVPVCADPYCMQCKVAMQSAQLNPAPHCPSGCTQCTRDRFPGPHGLSPASASLHSLPGLHHGLAGSSSSAAAIAAALYGHSAGVGSHPLSSSGSTPALVCNWVGGGKYCGERFSTSEELMTHLRSHTSSLEQSSLHAASLAAAAAAAASSPYAGYAQLHSLSHLYPSSLSPNSSLRSAAAASYSGRSLSPNSILSASSRFHPYLKSPLPGLSSAFPPTSIPGVQPSLGPYPSSLYALSGSRLGPLVP